MYFLTIAYMSDHRPGDICFIKIWESVVQAEWISHVAGTVSRGRRAKRRMGVRGERSDVGFRDGHSGQIFLRGADWLLETDRQTDNRKGQLNYKQEKFWDVGVWI